MTKILPAKRPNIRQTSFEKVCRYFLGDDWKANYKVVEVSIRNPLVNFFDDELAVWTHLLAQIVTFNWNTQPSALFMRGEAKAILKKGVHFYKLSYHHINEPKKRIVALRPATTDAALPVWRSNGKGGFFSSIGYALNQHPGYDRSTSSEGCQTGHYSQYPEFIRAIGNALGYKVPLGIIKNADPILMKGLGKIPYILIDQKDFDYIINLPESEFDSVADLKYQAANFVNVPKIEKVKPTEIILPNSSEIIRELELETFENLQDDEIKLEIPEKIIELPRIPLPEINNCFGEQIPRTPEPAKDKFNPKDFTAYIPQIDTAKRWLKTLSGLTGLGAIGATIAGMPQWIVISLLILFVLIVIGAIVIFVKYHDRIFEYVKAMNTLRATEGVNNPIISGDTPGN